MNTVLGRCGWRRWQGLGLWAWTSPERHRRGVQRLVQSEEAAGSLVQGRGDLSLPSCLPSANPTKELLNTHGTGIRVFLLTMPRGNGCSCAPPQTGSYPSDHAFLLCDNVAVQSVAFVPLLPKLCLLGFGLASAGLGHRAALGQAQGWGPGTPRVSPLSAEVPFHRGDAQAGTSTELAVLHAKQPA